MIGEADYRSITSAVRTPRFVAFIDEKNPYWHTAVTSLIRVFSQTWGGKYFLIVPTDGKRIKDKYWELLESYSPDYLGKYQLMLADLEEADPAEYKAVYDRSRKNWKFSQDFDEWFQKEKYHSPIGNFAIDRSLEQELKNRLAPTHHDTHVVRETLIRDHGMGFPFTKITDINPNAHRPVKKLVLPKPTTDMDLRAMVLSQSGDLDPPTLEEYTKQGVSATTLPDDYKTEDMVEAVMRGGVDPTDLKVKKDLADQFKDEPGASWTPDEDFVMHMPFQASMLHLGWYYRLDTHRDWEEPVTVVIGDSVDDFCLYYCLSRLHGGVFWLPNKWLDECERRRVNNLRLRRRGRPTRPYTQTASVADVIVRLLYRAIDFGQHEKSIELRSVTLDAEALKRTLRIMDRVHWGGEFSSHARVKSLSDKSTECIVRVIEANNYSNQQDMVFIHGKSVGRVATPKPKNFSFIDPANHRWMTSSQITEYTPPPLPFLGAQVALTHESRVATDGIVYLCPSIGYFGGDIDAILARPQLVIVPPQEIMRQYFAEAGLEIQPSDKGNYLSDTIDRFGGLEAAAKFIAEPDTRGLLDLFALIKKSAADGHVVFLREEGRAFVNYDGVNGCVGNDKAAPLIDELIAKDILRRGLIFLCIRCRLASWYDLAALSTEFTCRRCGQKQQFTKANWKMPEEPRWYYALAETVYQCQTHNSYLTILALDYLRKRSKESFHFLPEIDVINFPRGERHEIDVACLLDGRIILGECKTEPLRPSHADKYEALAVALMRRPDEIVFATTREEVSEAFRLKVGRISGATILTGKDLLK